MTWSYSIYIKWLELEHLIVKINNCQYTYLQSRAKTGKETVGVGIGMVDIADKPAGEVCSDNAFCSGGCGFDSRLESASDICIYYF